MVTRRVTFRLYPKSSAEKKLHWARKMHKELYNSAIANRRVQYERFGHSVSYYEQQNSLPVFKDVWTEYKQLGSQTLQATLKRVDLAYQSFGIDFGTYHAAALSDGTLIENPRFQGQSSEKIKKASKQKRRKRAPNFQKKIKESKRWKKASRKVYRLQQKVSNQRQDWTHKVANQLVSGNSLIATEELNLKGMTRKAKKGSKRQAQKTGLNRSMLDVGIGNLISAIEYKLQEAGGFLVMVPTKKIKPSQTCPDCGHQRKKDRSERVHKCSECGAIYDRDVAAAMVMLSWALGTNVLKRGEEIPTSIPCHTGGWKQISSLKRQKLTVQRSNGE